MKKHLLLALAVSLFGAGMPLAAPAAGSDDTSGTDQARSAYERAVKLVEAADYEDAIRVLRKLNKKEPRNPDVLNMLGFSQRKLGRTESALDYYQQALAIEPLHLGANEYLGELYLETGKLGKAQERLAELAVACPSDCEEWRELAEAVDAYKAARGL